MSNICYLWLPLPSCLQTSHSNFLPVFLTILWQFCLTCSAASTIHLSARECSRVPTMRYPISSERYFATPRIRDSEIWGRFVTGFVLRVEPRLAYQFWKNVSGIGDLTVRAEVLEALNFTKGPSYQSCFNGQNVHACNSL